MLKGDRRTHLSVKLVAVCGPQKSCKTQNIGYLLSTGFSTAVISKSSCCKQVGLDLFPKKAPR